MNSYDDRKEAKRILPAGSSCASAKKWGLAQLDTALDSTALAERRSSIRRGSEVFATLAGSETGAPGAGSG